MVLGLEEATVKARSGGAGRAARTGAVRRLGGRLESSEEEVRKRKKSYKFGSNLFVRWRLCAGGYPGRRVPFGRWHELRVMLIGKEQEDFSLSD